MTKKQAQALVNDFNSKVAIGSKVIYKDIFNDTHELTIKEAAEIGYIESEGKKLPFVRVNEFRSKVQLHRLAY